MAFDLKRSRLLMFSNVGKQKGDVAAYDVAKGEARWMAPAGADQALVSSRETIYLPEADAVLIGARVKVKDGWRWLAYDCGKNAWVALVVGGEDPIGKRGAFNNSMGLMYDPARKLVWAVGQMGHVHVLRLDWKTVSRVALGGKDG
jgi:hypothetical protein